MNRCNTLKPWPASADIVSRRIDAGVRFHARVEKAFVDVILAPVALVAARARAPVRVNTVLARSLYRKTKPYLHG